MIKSGTTCFNDMYWHMLSAAHGVEDSGIRGIISGVVFDNFDSEKGEKELKRSIKDLAAMRSETGQRVMAAYGPHAVYTVSNELLLKIAECAKREEILIHIHMAETEKENQDYLERTGKRPVELLGDLGFFGPNVIIAHSVWFNDQDIEILSKFDVKASHNPTSNMKLSIGSAIPYDKLKKAGIKVCLGTDGCASNNNLDMFESMKIATLLQKFHTNNQTIMPAPEVFSMATANGAKALGLNAGELIEGKLADVVLLDLKHPSMVPNHDTISNIVYSANGSVVRTTICDGKPLMIDRQVEGEDEVLAKCQEHASKLMQRDNEDR
jgi:5-methylthioadenosine/S-adenosylhomocysteine deaminase